MNRRNFLKNGSLTGLILTPLATFSKTKSGNPYAANDSFPLLEATIEELQEQMRQGKRSSVQITTLYLRRIEETDQNGPSINSVIEINPDALNIAAHMDEERKAGKVRGPLHGIPILLKDNIDTADKMMTTAGSLALDGNIAWEDAFIVKQLRKAGAVILGKTNMSEWANFRSTNSTSGWSSRGRQTKNPVVLTRNPSGSSSGSGAAVAANLCAAAVGTETNGSIIAPASNCGIVGIKPTVGLLSRSGIIPISKTQDTPGPMARTVKDAAILLQMMVGIDANDGATKESKGKTARDYTANLNANGLQGKRIGIEKSFLKGRKEVVRLFTTAIKVLKDLGATIVEVELLKASAKASGASYTVLCYEFKEGVNKYLANAHAQVQSLADVIAFNKHNEAVVMPYFRQEILETSDEMGDLNNQEYREALTKTTDTRKIIDNLMKDNQLDAICAVSMGPACLIDLVLGDYGTTFYFPPPAAMAGYPHITVPTGKVHGLPVGFSFMAGAYKEADIIQMAYSFEQATQKREVPQFLEG